MLKEETNKSCLKDILIFIGGLITLPIWVIFVIIILFSIPKDYDEYRSSEDELGK